MRTTVKGIELEIRGKQNVGYFGNASPSVLHKGQEIGNVLGYWSHGEPWLEFNEAGKALFGVERIGLDPQQQAEARRVANEETTYDEADRARHTSAEEKAEWDDDQNFWSVSNPFFSKKRKETPQFDENDIEQFSR